MENYYSVIPLQLMAYYLKEKNIDPDKPRNLSLNVLLWNNLFYSSVN